MAFELWGAQTNPYLVLPVRLLGYFLLLLYSGFFIYTAAQFGRGWRQFTQRQWLLTLSLSFAAVIASQLFLIDLPSNDLLPPIDVADVPLNLLRLIGLVPILIAAIILDPPLVLLVGLAGGLGRAGWQTHQLFDIFHFAAVAWVMAVAIKQRYKGTLYTYLRNPLIISVVGLFVILPPLAALATYSYSPSDASELAALDLSRSVLQAQAWLALLEGLISGALVWLVVWAVPALQEQMAAGFPAEAPPPFSRTLSRRLISRFGLYSAILIISLTTIVFYLSLRVSTTLVIDQMVHDANTASNRIPEFRNIRQNLLIQHAQEENLMSGDADMRIESLRELFRTGTFYRRLMVVEADLTAENPFSIERSAAFFPNDVPEVLLTNLEKAAVTNALSTGAPTISQAQEVSGSGSTITFVTPILDEEGRPIAALLGRVSDVSLQELIAGISGTVGAGSGFIVDEEDRIIAHPDQDSLLTPWLGLVDEGRILRRDEARDGIAYEGRDGQTNTRRLVYFVTGPDHPWTVVITVPYDVVLGRALQTGMPIISFLALATLLFSIVLAFEGNSIARPLGALVKVARQITAGEYDTPVEADGDDEVGELGRAFIQMQKALAKRLDELSLLLDVSQSVSTSLNNLSGGVPTILKGAIRNTGASGVRMAVFSPTRERRPLLFGEGPASERMAEYDRKITRLLAGKRELVLQTPAEVRQVLDIPAGTELPFQAAIAMVMSMQNRSRGIFWLVHRQPHEFDSAELNLLRTLVTQAVVMLENARLYSTAEGGRRRLAAVLSSTADAVIVTDATDQVLLLNPAMEQAFDLDAREVRGRRVQDVIRQPELVELFKVRKQTLAQEIPLPNGKTFFANASTIINTDGQTQGRVVVLHDITYLKELDEMKSNFVQMVSHDLRSPLTYMNGFVNMVPMVGDINEKQEEYLDKIQIGIDQMNTLVKNILDLGRLEAGLELMRAPSQMIDIINTVIDNYQPMANESGLTLVRIPADKIPYLYLDTALVQQSIANLTMNAIKYAPHSGEVQLMAKIVGSEVVVSIADKGPGISRQDQIRLFEKFYRVQQRDSRAKGSGLGLAIVKSVAERHGGRAWFTSNEGEGSTFYLSFPLEPVDFNTIAEGY